MRGLSGSGKSTFCQVQAKCLQKWGLSVAICSADDYFTNEEGEYVFDANRLPEVHASNVDAVEAAMSAGVDVIFVDNTNVKVRDYEAYIDLALRYRDSYTVRVREIPVCIALDDCRDRSIHGVPRAVFAKQMECWESDDRYPDYLLSEVLKNRT